MPYEDHVPDSESRQPQLLPLRMFRLFVEEVASHCHLGLRLKSDGKWSNQVEYIIARAESRLRILKGYSRRLCRSALRQLYLSYIGPILEYSNQV